MYSSVQKFVIAVFLAKALTGCSTYVSQLEGQAFEPVDPAVSLVSEKPSRLRAFRFSLNAESIFLSPR